MMNKKGLGVIGVVCCLLVPSGQAFDTNMLARAITDLSASFPDKYTQGAAFMKALGSVKTDEEFLALQRKALLANPLLDFDKLLIVRRGEHRLGLPQNWESNCGIGSRGYSNDIAVLSIAKGSVESLFRPSKGAFVGDVDLHCDADRMLISMPGEKGRWHVWELKADGTGLRQVTPEEPGVDQYDACYLPDGGVIFGSTAAITGVPCVGGGSVIANLFRMNADGTGIRRLTFDQENNWYPTVLNDGRVMYTRWEYTDTPHYFTRLLFTMNPDGTSQSALYGSNSYWPNSIFYARPIPGSPGKVVGVVSGHHGVARMGELVVFDTARGRVEADGVVQRIPGYGKKVEPVIRDQLVDGSWPRFLHPYPLNDKYFVVACKPSEQAQWGIYLVDIFDNMVLLHEEPGLAMLEPVPFRKTERPPVIPDRVRLGEKEATVYLNDIYAGPGLKGVPRGTVKKLRVITYHYAYPGMGGHINIGVDGCWDVHRIIGTVPVNKDGSVAFKVPANTPLAIQPLDENGQAIQLMRSWFTAMPGELVSCVGCHDTQNNGPASRPNLAFRKAPVAITPWYGPTRGFSFPREVQPVLDRYCIGCHEQFSEGQPMVLLKPKPRKTDPSKPVNPANVAKKPKSNGFDAPYIALHPFVRRPGPESDYHLQNPFEYHASTSELIQMLRQGHHGVTLDKESWDRLITWIDLNVPDHGTWGEHRKVRDGMIEARHDLLKKYAGMDETPEVIIHAPAKEIEYEKPASEPGVKPSSKDWSFDPAKVKGLPSELKFDLGNGQVMELVLVPARHPFYMGKFETMNAQFRLFDPDHDSGVISRSNKDQVNRGISVNEDRQPVVRVSWNEARDFCAWLSKKTGKSFSLPTEDQWEWACRGGRSTPMWYGEITNDFSKVANLADSQLLKVLIGNSPPWIPVIASVNDGATVTAAVGHYQPNPFGLYDMHGNAAEWTASSDRDGKRICRGGSFYDRPYRATATAYRSYLPYQPVFDVGFRVLMEK